MFHGLFFSHLHWCFLFGILSMSFMCSSVHVSIPYLICKRVNDEKKEPDTPHVCYDISSRFLIVNIEEPYTDQELLSICKSDFGGFYTEMSYAISDWSLDGCVVYLKFVIEPELLAQKMEKEWKKTRAESNAKELEMVAHLNSIQDSHPSYIEGSLWRSGGATDEVTLKAMARKRDCFKGILSLILPENAHLAEVGFNAGHSTTIMMHLLPSIKVTSFDLCSWYYTKPAHEHLKSVFGERTELICGDSVKTLPAHVPPVDKYDAIFVDAGHLYSQAKLDIYYGSKLVKSGGFILVDDCDANMGETNETNGFGGVNDAWRHMVALDYIKPLPFMFDTCEHSGICIGRLTEK